MMISMVVRMLAAQVRVSIVDVAFNFSCDMKIFFYGIMFWVQVLAYNVFKCIIVSLLLSGFCGAVKSWFKIFYVWLV